MKPIKLLPSASRVTADEIARSVGGDICVCDFYVEGAEAGMEVPGGYQFGGILNIDHHAPGARMARLISSANLAIAQVLQCGLPTGQILINHTDCDSILSSGIVAGRLEPIQVFGDAAIAADHTGEDDEIADLLQALSSERDIELSFSNLRRMLDGQPVDASARLALDDRRRKRAVAEKAVASGLLSVAGGLAFGVLDEAIDSEFFPALLPTASVILLASRMRDSDLWQMKLRLGSHIPDGLTLHALRISSFDPGFGGRWNAGSNKRAGGSALLPDTYAAHVRALLASFST